jgi:hypothetical protein
MAQAAQQNAGQMNIMARSLVTGRAIKRTQSIFRRTIDPATQPVVAIEPRNTGLLIGFQVNVTYNVAVAGGGTPLTLTPYGASNSFKNVTFFDLNNNSRINTSGRHLAAVNSMRAGRPYLGVDTFTGYPVAYGDYNTTLVEAAATIAAGANSDVAMTYFVPVAYSEKDLRGSIYAGVVNATMSLQLTLQAAAVNNRTLTGWSEAVYATADAATAPSGVTLGNFTIEVLQIYYDQLPAGQSGVILPALDLAVNYELKETAASGITANTDYSIPYSNFRDFASTIITYRNRVNANGFMNPGDVNTWALRSANFTDIFEVRERWTQAWNRQVYGLDLPNGVFCFQTREKPISTVQFGNMEIVLDAADAQTGANVLIGYEAFSLTNTIGNAASLAGGAG